MLKKMNRRQIKKIKADLNMGKTAFVMEGGFLFCGNCDIINSI